MSNPKISIIIPTLNEKSKPYLDLCIDGIMSLNYPRELLDVSIISPTTYVPKYDGVKNMHHPTDERSFAEAVNYGILNSDQSSKHVFLLSDDTIPTRDSLQNLVNSIGDCELLMAATSNCDRGWKYDLHFTIPDNNGELLSIDNRYFRIKDLQGLEWNLKNSSSLYLQGVVYTDTLCFYAVLIPRSVINKVGLLDEKFRDGYEDSDFCHRAKLIKIPCAFELSSLIFHAGGATTSETLTAEITASNKKYFFEKWG